jgi:hypothetical protein
MRRNLFYVTLAMTRFLYGFETRETFDTYTHLASDPDGVPDESYYRSRKRVPLDEIRQRFEPRVRIERGSDVVRLQLLELVRAAMLLVDAEGDDERPPAGRTTGSIGCPVKES